MRNAAAALSCGNAAERAAVARAVKRLSPDRLARGLILRGSVSVASGRSCHRLHEQEGLAVGPLPAVYYAASQKAWQRLQVTCRTIGNPTISMPP